MTPCERMGYKPGDLFRVSYTRALTFEHGSIIMLEADDGTDDPLFALVEGKTRYRCSRIRSDHRGAYERLRNLEKIEEE